MSASAAPVDTGSKPIFIAITPCRVMDTRPAPETVGPRNTPLGVSETHTITVVGANGNCTGIPTDAVGVSMNVAAVFPTANSFLTVFPGNGTRPLAANLNWIANQAPTSNAVNVRLSVDGKVSFFNLFGTVHVTADINGYYIDHNHDDRYYTKAQVDAALLLKANTPVASAEILDGTITNLDMGNDSITSNKILDGAIGTADLADNAVTSTKILDATILAADLATGSVTSAKVLDDTAAGGGLAAVDLANNSVDSSEIATDAVNATEIANDTIDSGEIIDFSLSNQDVNVFYAVLQGSALGVTVVRSSPTATANRVSIGSYNVNFGRDISSCGWTATAEDQAYNDTGPAIPVNVNALNVHVHSDAGTLFDGRFHVTVVC